MRFDEDIVVSIACREKQKIFESAGDIGIGTTNPRAKLKIAGQVKITGGNPDADKVLASDANRLTNW